ncbi:PD40 domain-containing protein [candidate division FCPU426 bacterium]|nr:PD40 domain-containing protein [candidate division FCPU426 bacterium]
MRAWFTSSFWDDDGLLLKAMMVFALLILLLILLFGPPQYSSRVVSAGGFMVQPGIFLSQNIAPMVKIPPKPHVLYLTEKPGFPPVMENTPVPTPTPAGGGILRKIAFASNRADGRYYQLYMMDADGNHLERLLESNSFDRDPHFSYDGTRIAFTSNRSGTYQIYVLDMATRAVRQITRGPEDKTNPFWSPNDQQILFTMHTHESAELGIMQADGSHLQRLTQNFGHSHGYGFSKNGGMISFESSMHNRSEIFIYDLMEKKAMPLLENDELTYQGDPVFSPAENKLVFSSNCLERLTRQLYVYDFTWHKYYRVTDDEMDKDDPIFSPDGSKIAYVARWENAWNIFIMDADGKHVRNLTKSYYDNMVPSWR